jgi:hypothetical protein
MDKKNRLKKLIMCALLVAAFIAASGFAASSAYTARTAGSTSAASPVHDNDSPTSDEVEFARQTSDLLVNELVAALFKEFDETTPQNVGQGKRAISLIFNNANRDIRLIGAFDPLLGGSNDNPGDSFEQHALWRSLRGQAHTSVERINNRWYYRRSVPLSNTLHQNCVLCHTSFTPEFFSRINNPGQWVGALSLRVPIE